MELNAFFPGDARTCALALLAVALVLLLAALRRLALHRKSRDREGTLQKRQGRRCNSVESASVAAAAVAAHCEAMKRAELAPASRLPTKRLYCAGKKAQAAFSPWWSCCTGGEGRDRSAGQVKAKMEIRKGDTHPKFIGFRLRSPTDPPNCRAFPTVDVDGSVYMGWSLLKHTPLERQLCEELEQAVSDVRWKKDPITLVRHLRARDHNVAKAAEMYRNTVRWRDSNGLARGYELLLIDDSLHRRYDDSWKLYGLLGHDRDGDCVLYDRVGRIDMGDLHVAPEEFIVRHEIYTQTRIQQALNEKMLADGRPYFQITFVIDFDGLGVRHFRWMRAIQKFKASVRIAQDHYPEMVKRILFIRTPDMMAAIWGCAKTFIDKGTQDKIEIVGAKDTFQVISRYISPEWIPEQLGGSCNIGGCAECTPFLPKGCPVPPDLLRELWAKYG